MEQNFGVLDRNQGVDIPETGKAESGLQGPGVNDPGRQAEVSRVRGDGYDIIIEAISRNLDFDGNGKNYDIYEQRLTAKPPMKGFEYVPFCVYFFYVRINRDGRLQVDHYFYPNGPADDTSKWKPIPYEDMPALVERLALNARSSVKDPDKNPKRMEDSTNFDPIPFRRKSYIAIFFDEANWHFHQRVEKPSVAFDPHGGEPNHSFFDAQDITLWMPNLRTGVKDKRTAIFFVNHMKRNAAGDDLGAESQSFKFDMWLIATYASDPDRKGMSVNFDPTDTNTGPPLQP